MGKRGGQGGERIPQGGQLAGVLSAAIASSFDPVDMVAKALQEGEDPEDKWEMYGGMHRQAGADAALFTSFLKHAKTLHEVSSNFNANEEEDEI